MPDRSPVPGAEVDTPVNTNTTSYNTPKFVTGRTSGTSVSRRDLKTAAYQPQPESQPSQAQMKPHPQPQSVPRQSAIWQSPEHQESRSQLQ